MIIRIDVKGALDVHWPLKVVSWILLAETLVAYEATRPIELRLSSALLAMIQAALADVKAAAATATGGETTRATAAEQYRQALPRIRQLMETALLSLRLKYKANLAQLEAWGLKTKSSTRGVTVLKPRNAQAWADFAVTYAEKEQSLPAANRITDPPLADIETVANLVKASLESRQTGRTQREVGTQTRGSAEERLGNLLQTAGLMLVTMYFDGVVTNDLQAWGFEVTAKAAPKAKEPSTETPSA